MPPQGKRNLLIGIVVVAIAILFALWLMLAQIFGWSTPSLKKTGTVTNVPVSQLPKGFPSNTPFLSVVRTDQSFNVDNGATMQAGQKYISSMPLLRIFDLYKQFYSQTGWTLSNFVSGDVVKVGAGFTGTKGSDSVILKLMVDPTSPTSTDVYITYTLPK